ncbi:MAG: chromosomal replication initiator protein DnaA [Coriobacteriia bacterium]|nr:chromosomal replication initiator protein DnaA [Coriobacteriia bacterium]
MSDLSEKNELVTELDKNDMDYLWEKSLEILGSHPDIPESRFKSLFLRMSPINFSEDGIFSLGVPNKFNQRLVEKTCLPPIVETLRQVSERNDLEIIIEVDESVPSSYNVAPLPPELITTNLSETNNTSENPNVASININDAIRKPITETPKKSPLSKSDFNDLKLDSKYTFSSFIVGDSNNFAYTSALAVAESPALSYNPLFIWGASGLGKTHLLHAVGNHISEIYPEKRIVCTTAKNLVEQFVRATTNISKKSHRQIRSASAEEEMRNHYRNADLLLVDDIQDLKGEGTTNNFFHTFNYLIERRKQIVLVADRSPEELKLDERITSRFKSGLMVDVQPPTYEMRCAILRNFVKDMSIPFTDDSIDLIAEKSSDNIRELEGAVIRANAWATINKQPIANLEVVEKAIAGYFPEKEARPISISAIQKEVCRCFGVTHTELTGSKRKQEIVFPRHIAMFLSAELTDSSTPQIGKAFGNRDHTTVMHAVDKIKKKMKTETETLDQIQYLTRILRNKAM